jgi:hypothetical protein
MCDDGKPRAAMRGCFKLFPQSPLVREQERLLAKQKRQCWGLNRDDSDALAAIEACSRGEIGETAAMRRVKLAKSNNTARYRRSA